LFCFCLGEPRLPIPVSIDASKAIEIARAFAIARGVPAQNWQAKAGYGIDNIMLSFVNAKSDRTPLWNISSPLDVMVTLRALTDGESARMARYYYDHISWSCQTEAG